MKVRFLSSERKASTLLATALLAIVVAGTLGSYLLVVQSEYKQVARSQAWNKSLMISEAGVEEALAFINKYQGTATPMPDWSTGASAAADGWSVNGNVYTKSNMISPDLGYYVVTITNKLYAPTILSSGTAYWKLSSAPPPLTRKIFVQTKFDVLIPGALVALSTIDLNGNNIMVDSFDSSDPAHSDWQTNILFHGTNFGFYPKLDAATKRLATAIVATDTNIINVGGAEVYGYVATAPGGTVNIKNNGTVGDTSWIGPNPSSPLNSGLQPGHARDDMNVTFTDVALTNATWATLGPGSGTMINSNNYSYVITNSGTYTIPGTLTASLYVGASNVTLYLPSGMKMSSGDALTIGTNADLTIYSGDSIYTSGGAQINNENQISLALGIYGLPPGRDTAGDVVNGCTSISVGGNGVGTGWVYAPEASLSFNGGGSGVYNVVGAYVAHDIQLNGHYQFHYDDALTTRGPNRGFIPTEWKEIIGP